MSVMQRVCKCCIVALIGWLSGYCSRQISVALEHLNACVWNVKCEMWNVKCLMYFGFRALTIWFGCSGRTPHWGAAEDLCEANGTGQGADMVRQSKEQWIEERREKFRCPHCGEVVACFEEGVLGLYSAKIFTRHQQGCEREKTSYQWFDKCPCCRALLLADKAGCVPIFGAISGVLRLLIFRPESIVVTGFSELFFV